MLFQPTLRNALIGETRTVITSISVFSVNQKPFRPVEWASTVMNDRIDRSHVVGWSIVPCNPSKGLRRTRIVFGNTLCWNREKDNHIIPLRFSARLAVEGIYLHQLAVTFFGLSIYVYITMPKNNWNCLIMMRDPGIPGLGTGEQLAWKVLYFSAFQHSYTSIPDNFRTPLKYWLESWKYDKNSPVINTGIE